MIGGGGAGETADMVTLITLDQCVKSCEFVIAVSNYRTPATE